MNNIFKLSKLSQTGLEACEAQDATVVAQASIPKVSSTTRISAHLDVFATSDIRRDSYLAPPGLIL
jgi:hypothetical protein